MHDDVVRTVLVRFGGREVETAGDSFLIVFDSAERAIRCGLALVEALAAIRVPIRVGMHSGEVALTEEHVRGIAVHTTARILGEARQGEVLVSGTTRDLAEGAAGLAFEPRGRHRRGRGEQVVLPLQSLESRKRGKLRGSEGRPRSLGPDEIVTFAAELASPRQSWSEDSSTTA